MREFGMHGHHCGRRFGGHRFAKPLVIGVVLLVVLGTGGDVALECRSSGNCRGENDRLLAGVRVVGAVPHSVWWVGFSPGDVWHRRMHERWMQMTPEQREEFIRTRRGIWSSRSSWALRLARARTG